MWILEQYSTKR